MQWPDLIDELDAWRDEGRIASLWWRDDDAVAPAPALDRLAGLAGEHQVTVGLAVIPALAQPALAAWLGSAPVEVLQHGWQHRSHAAPGEKKSELAGHRQAHAVAAELAGGFRRLGEIAGDRLRPVLVPPWNRIAPDLLPTLPRLGFRGLSAFGPRPAVEPVPGLRQVSCHVDVVDWRGGRGFVGCDRALAAVVAHLAARRTRSVDPAEPTGLLTHHAVHEESTWAFLARFVERTRRHPAARWLMPQEAIPPMTFPARFVERIRRHLGPPGGPLADAARGDLPMTERGLGFGSGSGSGPDSDPDSGLGLRSDSDSDSGPGPGPGP